MQLSGKRFIVTGAATGMGAATVRAYVKEGASVVGLFRNRKPTVQPEGPGRVSFAESDVSDKTAVDAAVARAVATLGGLNALVHAAAIARTTAVEHITVDEYEQVMGINMRGIMLTNQAVFPYLKERGWPHPQLRVVDWRQRQRDQGALRRFKGRCARLDAVDRLGLGAFRITANAVCPVIRTEMYESTRRAMTQEQLAAHDASLSTSIPLGGEFGDADRDFAPVIIILGSDGARFLTGQTYAVDGGSMMVR